MNSEVAEKKKFSKLSLIFSVVSFVLELFMSPLEFITIPFWIISLVLTVITAKKNRIWLNVIFLVITFVFIANTFWLMHLSPYHEYVTVEFEF